MKIETLKNLIVCPLCGRTVRSRNPLIWKSGDEIRMTHLTCHRKMASEMRFSRWAAGEVGDFGDDLIGGYLRKIEKEVRWKKK